MASNIIRPSYTLLCRTHIVSPKAIIYVDGGICSQMNQYLLGMILAKNGNNIGYDLHWFRKYGVDMNGIYKREYELEQMFPYLYVHKFSKITCWFYRLFLCYTSSNHTIPELSPAQPIYLGGYYSIPSCEYSKLFAETFDFHSIHMTPVIRSFLEIGMTSCAVHVRRGDLAKGDNPYYGSASVNYFIRAINLVSENYLIKHFVFFSDELDFVKQEIAPYVTNVDLEYGEGNFKAYEILSFIAAFKIIIGSQGSFGKIAAMLNPSSTLVLPNNKYSSKWVEIHGNVILVDE